MKTFILINFVLISAICFSQPSNKFEARDVFDLEYASDPRIEPDGERIVYVRNYKDVMTDANLSNLWMVIAGKGDDPTMLLTGEEDYRTPISESEQFYAGLKINNVDASLVRIPGASHGIAKKPSHLIAKVNYITSWFEEHKKDKS